MIYRIDVRVAEMGSQEPASKDPVGEALRHQIAEFGTQLGPISTGRIFLIDSEASPEQMQRVAAQLLADPIVETAQLVAEAADDSGVSRIEIHLKPGVMDPVAASTEMAMRDMGLKVKEVRTGRAYVIQGHVPRQELQRIAGRVLANGVIESVHFDMFRPVKFPAAREETFQLRTVALRELSEEQLQKLSREGHLFLSAAEMQAVQEYFRGQKREPTDVELETIAQTWSEHCVHKTLKSAVTLEVTDEDGAVVDKRHYGNLIKDTIFKSTMDLTNGGTDRSFCLSVFGDNSGVVAFDEQDAVCFKVETHNHPSAIEPYGGSATGIGGVIRDILGTGLGAKPVANTDVFCVAYPQGPQADGTLPKGVIHPKRILQQVVAGVRDYGNRMGIPTINGAVYFDDRYLGNPLVFCGCVGLIPRNLVAKASRPGDAIVVMGGRTGRDGIHGATFSSAELTDTHADEFSHAVQIGNAIAEKKVTDVILQARDRGLFTAVTDCGAGGLSSAVGEMGETIGAVVELDRVPLKYAGLRYDEIWISEAQERMVLAVPPEKVEELLKLSAGEDVESTVIGTFGSEEAGAAQLVLNYRGQRVGKVAMEFLHGGIPRPMRRATVQQKPRPLPAPLAMRIGGLDAATSVADRLLAVLAHPNVASKHWIIRQYDHEVQGGSVVKPLTGPRQVGPSDAAVLRPKLGSERGVAIGCGMAPYVDDPYRMAIAAIDEAIRNVVAVGADPQSIALLDNFCWPSVDDEKTMGTLVRACEACYDAAQAYGTPFISGKDSLHNQFTDSQSGQVIRIPNTLLISAMAVVRDVRKCITMDLKRAGHRLGFVRQLEVAPELAELAATHKLMAQAIAAGHIASCHDVSDGGPLVAAAEMCIASGLGLDIKLQEPAMFRETQGCYLIEFDAEHGDALRQLFSSLRLSLEDAGAVIVAPRLIVSNGRQQVCDLTVKAMTTAWRGTLDW